MLEEIARERKFVKLVSWEKFSREVAIVKKKFKKKLFQESYRSHINNTIYMNFF